MCPSDTPHHTHHRVSNIAATIMHLPSAKEQQKAFSTYCSHLIVLSLMYGSSIFIYVKPKQVNRLDSNKEAALVNTVVTPLLNPVIYTLRNKQVHQALKNNVQDENIKLKKNHMVLEWKASENHLSSFQTL